MFCFQVDDPACKGSF